jgi:hypothetical protein
MIASVEIVTCIVALLGTVKFTAAEYARLRKSQQVGQALRRACENASLDS